MKHLSEPWFSLIKEGTKKVEGRIYKDFWKGLKIGDIITFYNDSNHLDVRVVGLKVYENFQEFLSSEGVENCLPGYKLEEGLEVYYKIYSKNDEKMFGIVGIHIERI